MMILKYNIQKVLLAIVLILFLSGCTTQKLRSTFKKSDRTESYFKGFVLYDPSVDKTLVNHHGAKYFTPASNTKLFTFYSTYRSFQDSVKSLAYYQAQDSLIIRGTADPSFWYGFETEKTKNFLENSTDTIYLLDAQIDDPIYGPGWSWEDFETDFMPERSLFPVHSNLLTITSHSGSIETEPRYFLDFITVVDSLKFARDFYSNTFFIEPSVNSVIKVPFRTSNLLVAELLRERIGKEVVLIPDKKYPFSFFYGMSYEELLKQMMVVSDNFIAEQLMLQVGEETTGMYSVKKGIEFALANYLTDIPHPPRWVDGSGLSRYNLFTPEDMVYVLKKMYREIPLDKLFGYFPVGGQSGTLKNWYTIDGEPFVYAKSGTLSNNYNLSGYVRTQSGKVLIFSYMNNHYATKTSAIKKEIEAILKKIYYDF
ncbi:D-alanyl-D-alanine carboxypeptidase [Flavobacteriaceae bacterium F08102]|nr:D-alanyl-D-alanine carboxypeptidase [Flavobacteriaceae bacterium F08102]